MSCVMCHMSRTTCHILYSFIFFYFSYIFFSKQSGGASWLRVCYQRGLSRLDSRAKTLYVLIRVTLWSTQAICHFFQIKANHRFTSLNLFSSNFPGQNCGVVRRSISSTVNQSLLQYSTAMQFIKLHYITVQCFVLVVDRCICVVVQWFIGVLVYLFIGVLVQWYTDLVVCWCGGLVVQWCSGVMVGHKSV